MKRPLFNLPSLLFLAFMVTVPTMSSARVSRQTRKEVNKRLPTMIDLGRHSGVPAVRARATELCIRYLRKRAAQCIKDGAADPATDVRIATARALYKAGKSKQAETVLRDLVRNPRIRYQGGVDKLFRLPKKAQKVARGHLLKLLKDPKLPTQAERIREIARSEDPFSRSIFVAAALGKADPPRSDFKALITSLNPTTDEKLLGTFFKQGDDAMKFMVLHIYDKVSANTALPDFLTKYRPRRNRASALRKTLGILLAKHRHPAALPHLLVSLKSAKENAEQVELLMAMASIANSSVHKPVMKYTNKNKYPPEVRVAAWAILMRAGHPRGLKRVDRWLRSDKPIKRTMAAAALGRSKKDAAIPELSGLLNDGVPGVRKWSAQALGELGKVDAMEPLLQALNTQSDQSERQVIADALFRVVPTNRLEEVSFVLMDTNPDVRATALASFSVQRDAALVPFLQSLLGNTDANVRSLALKAIMLTDPKEGMLAFNQAMYSMDGSVLPTWVAEHGESIAPYVRQGLTSTRPAFLGYAIDALAALPASARLEIIKERLDKMRSHEARVRLMELLTESSRTQAIPFLEKYVTHADPTTRATAARLLATTGRGIDLVITALNDKDILVQMTAAAALLSN